MRKHWDEDDAWEETNLQAHWKLPLPIKTLSWPQWPPLALPASADHSFTHRQSSKHHSNMLHPSTAWNPAPDPVLTPYVVEGSEGSGGAERKATCALGILGRPASVTQHAEETLRQADRCSARLSTSLGWWSREIKGVYKAVIWASTCQAKASEQHCAPHFRPSGHVPSMLSVVEGAQSGEGLSSVLLRSWNMMGLVPSGPCGFSFKLSELVRGGANL